MPWSTSSPQCGVTLTIPCTIIGTEPEDIHTDVQEPHLCDTIVGRRICHTRTNSIPLFQVAKLEQHSAQEKWYSATEVADKFPHLNEYTMETILS